MVTPPENPANDTRPPWMRIVAAAGLLALGIVVALWLPSLLSGAAQPEPTQPAKRRRWDLRRASCKMAFEANPANLQFKFALARALPYERKAETIAMLREAAAQGSAEAYYEIYEHHKSWDRGDLDKVPPVTRAEADRALHRAAELGHPYSTQMLAILLDRGATVKRDPVAARYWAERAVQNPAKDETIGNLLMLLGRLLATSDKPDERARGIDILERTAMSGVFGARRELAIAIRRDDPVRARTLLEESRRPDPGGAGSVSV